MDIKQQAFNDLVKLIENCDTKEKFESLLYHSQAIEQLFQEEPYDSYCLWGRYKNLYYALIEKNYKNSQELYFAKKSIMEFLDNYHIHYTIPKDFDDSKFLLDLYHDTTPRWLDISFDYFKNHLLPTAALDTMKKKDIKDYIREQIKKQFICVRGVPNWTINPEPWPINSNQKPYIFVGNLSLDKYLETFSPAFGNICVFLDPETYQVEALLQTDS